MQTFMVKQREENDKKKKKYHSIYFARKSLDIENNILFHSLILTVADIFQKMQSLVYLFIE